MNSNNFNFADILKVTEDFYAKATTDFLIGYHFRNITDFKTHIPRIAHFWELQLTGTISKPDELPYRLMGVHFALKIKKGELGRWVLLFKEVLESHRKLNPEKKNVFDLWETKINFFQAKFLQHPHLFHQDA
ncbi:MAG: hypothetical protein JNM93_04960 [Bacteriovoracaceae bacterium]|nr:hypothetical protein [Bacteriovoracaceae bacterium]